MTTVEVTVDSDQNDERYPLKVRVKHHQMELSDLSVPVVVRRGDRIMCWTSHQQRDLNAREVLSGNSSSLNLLISTTNPELLNLTITVLLKAKKNEVEWTRVEDAK